MEDKKLYRILYSMLESYDDLDETVANEYSGNTDKKLGKEANTFYKEYKDIIINLEKVLHIETEEDRNFIMGIVKKERIVFDGFTSINIPKIK